MQADQRWSSEDESSKNRPYIPVPLQTTAVTNSSTAVMALALRQLETTHGRKSSALKNVELVGHYKEDRHQQS